MSRFFVIVHRRSDGLVRIINVDCIIAIIEMQSDDAGPAYTRIMVVDEAPDFNVRETVGEVAAMLAAVGPR